ncbi:zinc metallochaperone AztD [Vreelandella profundi]|uniref:zinc metallochaperone AztD n=1 Tax=Vreelandella profundi TaxID=2852117 RepID=UPI001F17CA54|nr:zinc metallochaperone AztD [Halomonas profundi]
MKKRILARSIAALAVAIGSTSAYAHDKGVTEWRLFVADQASPTVNVIDATDKALIDTYQLSGPAALHRTSSGQTVFAVQGSEGRVSAINTGIAFHDHGDHADIDVDAPERLDMELTGERPAHFVEQQGYIAQWFDGEDEARFFTENSVLEGQPEIRIANIEAAHHGVAVPYQHHAVVSIANPDDASQRPIGARVVDFEGNHVGEDVACPGLHGSAGSGSLYALACQTGLLIISTQDGTPEIEHLAYPASLPEGSASTLLGGKGLQYFIGNFGPDRLVIIDPSQGEEGFQLVQLPTRRVHFATDSIRPRFAYVFTEDGQLHKVDVLSGELMQSLRLTAPYSMDGHWNDPRPRIAVAGDSIVVTDPAAEKLHFVDANSFEEVDEMPLEGKPFNIVTVGGSGVSHHD